MKKLLFFVIGVLLIFSLVACAEPSVPDAPNGDTVVPSVSGKNPTDEKPNENVPAEDDLLKHEHTPLDAVMENTVVPDCTNTGSYDSVVYCSECHEQISRESVTLPMADHSFVDAPLALVILVDCSASMEGENLSRAIEIAKTCLDVLTDRDFVAVLPLSDRLPEPFSLTRAANRETVLASFDSLVASGRSVFSPLLELSGHVLSEFDEAPRKHILLITDGAPADIEQSTFGMKQNVEKGIGISIFDIWGRPADALQFQRMLAESDTFGLAYYHKAGEAEDSATLLSQFTTLLACEVCGAIKDREE